MENPLRFTQPHSYFKAMEATAPLDNLDSGDFGGRLRTPLILGQNAMTIGTEINEQIWYINNVPLANLRAVFGKEHESVVAHYVRDESRKLWQALEATTLVDKQFVILNVKGDPGSGKSLTCFGWASYQKAVQKAKICFITESYCGYKYTTLDDTDTHCKTVQGRSMSPFEDIVLETSADIYVVDNFAGPIKTNSNPTLALYAIVDALEKKKKKVTIILCSSIQGKHPKMHLFPSDQYSLRTHFVRGWTANEIIAAWYVAKTLHVPILPQALVDDKEKFIARLRVASGNMHYMHAPNNTEQVAQNQKHVLECKFGFCFMSSDFTYGRPDYYNWAFVHVSEKEVRLLNEYTQELMCERIRSCQAHTEQMLQTLNFKNTAPQWRTEIFMRFVFAYAMDKNMQLTFHKMSQSWRLFRKSLTIWVNRIVKYGPVLSDLSEWYIAPNESVVFLPGNSGQTSFDSVCVQRDRNNVFHVYFFRAAYGIPHRFLCAHGGVFLVTLFPNFLCEEESSAKTAWVRMKRAADQRQKEIDALEEKNRRKPYEEYGRSTNDGNGTVESLNVGESLGMDFYESLFPGFPPAHLINRPKKVKLHCYVVTGKDSPVDVSVCEMYDVVCMAQFDKSFTKDKVRVAHMTYNR